MEDTIHLTSATGRSTLLSLREQIKFLSKDEFLIDRSLELVDSLLIRDEVDDSLLGREENKVFRR